MSFRLLCVLSLSALLLGCTPKIGNSCTLSTDCSPAGDRLCDGTQPNGYCTIFNCQPDNCPNSICVAFDPSLDPACENQSPDAGVEVVRAPRFERTFCLAACNTDGDCRTDYACVDLSQKSNQIRRRAEVVDTGAGDGGLGYSVCMALALTADGGVIPEDAGGVDDVNPNAPKPQVCFATDAGFPTDGGVPWTTYDGGP